MTMTMTRIIMKIMIIMIIMTIIKQINHQRLKNPEQKKKKIQNKILIKILRQQIFIITEQRKNIKLF